MKDDQSISEAVRHFEVHGEFAGADPVGNGHINDSYSVALEVDGTRVLYVVQRINTAIFTRPVELMQNMERVTRHLATCTCGNARRAIELVPSCDGHSWHVDDSGAYWRMYRFIAGTHSIDEATSADQCFKAAHAFGDFQQQLTTLPGPRLHDTIPGFHDTPLRFAALERAIETDAAGRARLAAPEIDFALKRKAMCATLVEAGLPERITHNDTKINNVLLDDVTGEPLCVIDLDTVMPGLALYDFGDLVRTATCPAAEDERDLDKVVLRFDFFEALVRGYLAAASGFLTPKEKKLLPFSGNLITFETGIRFLADYLNGDTYFKVHREGHNLDRCRVQFKLIESMERDEHRMNRLVEALA